MAQTIADLIVDRLADAGVRRVYGIAGDSLNGILDSIRRSGRLDWVHVRHEEAAAFAAGAEAHLTGSLAVCAGSCGPGHVHLLNGLYDCHRSRVPVLAIASHIPSAEVGSSYFQETHPERLFIDCSHFCEQLSSPSQAPRMVDMAIQHATARQGVAVLVLSGDVSLLDAEGPAGRYRAPARARPVVRPSDYELELAANLLNGSARVAMLCGMGCAGAHDEVVQLAEVLLAPVVHTARAKEALDWGNPFDVGMTGLLGYHAGYHTMRECDALLMLGTDFPYQQFLPTDVPVVQVDLRQEHLGRRVPVAHGLVGDVGATVQALLPLLEPKADRSFLDQALKLYAESRTGLDDLATGTPGKTPIHPQYLTRLVDQAAAGDAVFTCDVGEPTIWASRYLTMNGRRRLIGSYNHGSMACALPQAIGAQASHPGRQVVSLSGDGGLTMLMGELCTLLQMQLPVKVVVYDNGALGYVELEQKAAGYLSTGTDLRNPDFGRMANAMGLYGVTVDDSGDLDGALREALAHPGPAVVNVRTNRMELSMPPKVTAKEAFGFSLYASRAVLSGRGDEVIDLVRTNVFR